MKNLKKPYLLFFLFISFLAIGLTDCRRNRNMMPYVPVDIYLNISLPAYSNLNIIGGWVYVTGGNNGILVYRQTYETILAFERRCTFEVENACGAVTVDSTGLTVVCECDGSKYHIFDGSVLEGPAVWNLYQYRTTFNVNTNQVHIFN
jgi:nitrite reductase/ring-hydroxylating ferredoxin subunit